MRRIVSTLLALFLAVPAAAQGPAVDILVRGGSLVDGTGTAARRADVGVRGDRIVFVGDAAAAGVRAERTIDATGLVVAPGFIDPHTHTLGDLSSANEQRRQNLAYLMQGVTTVVTNNDGGGNVEIGKTLDGWAKNGIGTNALLYVPQGSVRGKVLGMSDAKPTPAQLAEMKALVARGMEEGAFGMSTGLYYAPGSYASTEEVIELAREAAKRGGIYDSHMRDESSYTVGLLGAMSEVIRIGREAKIPVHISHIKALGADVWGESDTVIALVEHAQAQGVVVTADQYPYTASGTSVGASLLPRWAEVGGRDSLRARVEDPATRARLVAEMEVNMKRRGGPATLLISSTRDSTILGRNLAQISEARGVTPIDAALQIILAGDASVASFNMKDEDIERFMREPWVMTGSDGSAGHPRKYGTFPRILGLYVRHKHVLTLEQAVHRSSALPAKALGIPQRGTVARGNFADLVVFDPATIIDRSTYEEPTKLATGVQWVLVNGVVAVEKGEGTGTLAGRALRHTVTKSSAAGQ